MPKKTTGGEHIPLAEYVNKPYQKDKYGNHRIVFLGKESEWKKYHEIALLDINEEHYFAVTELYQKSTPFAPNTILKWSPVEIPEEPKEEVKIEQEV